MAPSDFLYTALPFNHCRECNTFNRTFPKGPNILLSVFAQIKTAFTLADQNHTYRHISFKLLRDLLKKITLTLKYLSYTAIHFIYAKKKNKKKHFSHQTTKYFSTVYV